MSPPKAGRRRNRNGLGAVPLGTVTKCSPAGYRGE